MKTKAVLLYTLVPDPAGFVLQANGKPLKTPAGNALAVRDQKLAESLLFEWQAQGNKINPQTMPLTQLVTTALDRVGPARSVIVAELIKYAQTELVCYRAEHPADLVAKQNAAWNPLLAWLSETHGLQLSPVTGFSVPEIDKAKVEQVITGFDVWGLTALQQAVAVTGSFVIGLALATGHINAETAFRAAECDALYQAERWGQDDEAVTRHKNILIELEQVQRFMECLS